MLEKNQNSSLQKEVLESQERYKVFIEQSNVGIWRFETKKPIPINLPIDKQIKRFYTDAYLAECNDVLAKMYGFEKSEEILGRKGEKFIVKDDPVNIEYFTEFIKSNYRVANAESKEIDKYGNVRYFLNSLVGIIENESLVRVLFYLVLLE